MKKKKRIIFIVLAIIIIIGVIFGIYQLLDDENKLTVEERNWLNDNINTIQNINVVNDVNIFGKDGTGVFYDFLEDFTEEYELKFNPITYNNGENVNGLTLGIKNTLAENDTVIYTDHYVLISKSDEIVLDYNELDQKKIGILKKDSQVLKTYINIDNVVSFETEEELLENFESKINYIIVPLNQELDMILEKGYKINYHFSDINVYYVLQSNNDIISSILTKFYNEWNEEFDEHYYESKFELITKKLNISETEIDKVQSVAYDYGFINTSPYEIIMGGEYGGIVAVYLSEFSKLTDIEFNFVKYKNYDKFIKAIDNKKIDIYFNYYEFNDQYQVVNGPVIEYTVIARKNDEKVINSIKSLINEEIYVQENTKLHSYLKSIKGINIKTYKSLKELFKLNKEDVYIVLDKNIYNNYNNQKLDNYIARYSNKIKDNYEFKVNNNDILTKLLDAYMLITDSKEMEILGIDNHSTTVKTGSILSTIAEYIIYIVLISIIIILLIIRKSKKITIAKKIKRDDKLKFIDQLTSLKNRNFLNENIEVWNNNTIYPQTIIVIDLNKVQEINDLHGYNEGDKQIMSAANALIKTQLDNSEIMRTDGNEFVIYLVGYTQKQVSNYIHKLNKELKKLPYNYGAEFGYSMIFDNIKTIEDAMNEAVEDMKKQKGSGENEKNTSKKI